MSRMPRRTPATSPLRQGPPRLRRSEPSLGKIPYLAAHPGRSNDDGAGQVSWLADRRRARRLPRI